MLIELSNRKVAFFSLAAALLGLALEIIVLVGFRITELTSSVIGYAKLLSPDLRLNFFDLKMFSHYGVSGVFSFYYLDVALYIVALFGVILFFKSHYRETRLLRFFFSIILFSKCLSVIPYFFFYSTGVAIAGFIPSSSLFFAISVSLWIISSVHVLKFLSKDRDIELIPEDDEPNAELVYKRSSKIVRLTHKIIDTAICFAICSPTLLFFESYILDLNILLLKCVVAISSLMIFYVFFESIFDSTPAKFLSESRLVQVDGQKLTFKIVAGRTFARFIPFESFSFLGAGSGCHDYLTNTTVVREKSIGISWRYYLLLIPIYILGVVGSFFCDKYATDYKINCILKNEHSKKVDAITEKLGKLGTNSVIVLNDIDAEYSYASTWLYLKIEKVNDISVEVSVFACNSFANNRTVEDQYNASKTLLDRVTLKLSDLRKGITPSYENYESGKREWLSIPHDTHKYEIEEIGEIFGPLVVGKEFTDVYNGYLSLAFENRGWGADIIEFKNIEGTLNWEACHSLHVNAAPSKSTYGTELNLVASNYKKGDHYKFTFMAVDSLGHKQKYLVDGIGFERNIKRIE